MLTAYHPPAPERRYAGLALTALVHAALLLGWQMSRHPPPDTGPAPLRTHIQWIRLPAPPAPAAAATARPARPVTPAPAHAAAPATSQPAAPRAPTAPATAPAAPSIAVLPAAPSAPSAPEAAPAPAQAAPSSDEILRRARRDIGKIDRALRKENNPYIVLPPDSPELRMRKGMEAAHDAVPPKLWEAPQIDTLVNDTGDGARRGRVRTGNGTYCVTDRGFNTSIDMIEKHGKQRITSCPQHELPPSSQEWRTARD